MTEEQTPHDSQQNNELDKLRETVQQLRERVEELERRVDSGDGKTSRGSEYDHYDEYVLERCDDPATTHPRRLMQLYEGAGIVQKETKKRRAKRLKRLEGEK